MPAPPDLTCVHCSAGLCEDCRREWETDPSGWLFYGPHPAGLARWAELVAEMAAERERPVECVDDSDCPF